MAKISFSEKGQSVYQLNSAKKSLRFDLAIQRNEVWDDERKSMLIHSMLIGYPLPPVFTLAQTDESDERALWFLDGKQRITTAIGYVNGAFILSEDTPPVDYTKADGTEVEDFEVAKLGYSQLPEELQREIDNYQIPIYIFESLSEDQRDDFFYRLNNGMPLKQIEKTRVVAGTEVMRFIQEMCKEPFFASYVDLTEKARNRFVDEEVILQIMYLLSNEGKEVGLGGTEILDFAEGLKSGDLFTKELKDKIRNTTEYLNQAFEAKEKSLKKVHIPMVFMVAVRALEDGVEPKKFSGWVQDFFKRHKAKKAGSAYNNATSSGSAKRERVTKRLEVINEDYTMKLALAPEYARPEEKDSKRGRKKTEDQQPQDGQPQDDQQQLGDGQNNDDTTQDRNDDVQSVDTDTDNDTDTLKVDSEEEGTDPNVNLSPAPEQVTNPMF